MYQVKTLERIDFRLFVDLPNFDRSVFLGKSEKLGDKSLRIDFSNAEQEERGICNTS